MLFHITCYFPTEDPLFFTILIDSEDYVQELIEAVQIELKSERRLELTPDELYIFKINIPLLPAGDLQSRALQWLHQQSTNDRITPTFQPVTSLFPTDPRLEGSMLNIIIADSKTLELAEDLGDPDAAYKRKIKKSLDRRYARLKAMYDYQPGT